MDGVVSISSSDSSLLWLVWATKGASSEYRMILCTRGVWYWPIQVSALIFQFLEFFNQFIEEIEYLWRWGPHLCARTIYFYWTLRLVVVFDWYPFSTHGVDIFHYVLRCQPACYYLFVNRILILRRVNFVLSEIIHSTPTKRLCMTAFIMKAATAQLTTTGVETILVVRGMSNSKFHARVSRSWFI